MCECASVSSAMLASIKLSLLGYLHESRVGNRCRFTLRSRPYSNGNQSQVARLSLLLAASFSPSSFSRLSFITMCRSKLEPNGCDSWVQISRRSFGNHTKERHANELRPKLKLKIKIKLFSVKLYEKVKERPETMDLRPRWPLD